MGRNNFILQPNDRRENQRGFTIVELVVVILVIGILAGISIVGYGAWRKQANTNQVKSDLNGVASAMESTRNFSTGYPTSIPSTFTASTGVSLSYIKGNSATYCIQAANTQDSTIVYHYDINDGKQVKSGACAAEIDNFMNNPNPNSATYWLPNSSSVLSSTFVTSGGYNAVRSTRLTTAAAALYGERNTGGVVTAVTGDQYTIMFTISSNVNTSIDVQIGYGSATSTSTISGVPSPTLTLTANVPQTVQKTFTVPSTPNGQPLFLKLLWGTNGAVGNYFDVYRVMWTKGTYSGSYGDGDTTGWVWRGATNASTSFK